MGFFNRAKNAPASVPKECTDRVRVCEDSLQVVRARRNGTATVLEQAEQRQREASAAFDAAAEVYSDDPSERNAKVVRDARDERELAELALTKPKRAHAEADRDMENAQLALEEAQAEVARAENEIRIAAAKEAASVPHFQAVTLPVWERYFAARKAVEEALDTIVGEFDKANAIAGSLQGEGVDCPLLHPFQLVHGYVSLRASEDLSLVDGILEHCRGYRGIPSPSPNRGDTFRTSLGDMVGVSHHLDRTIAENSGRPAQPLERLEEFFRDTPDGFEARESARRKTAGGLA